MEKLHEYQGLSGRFHEWRDNLKNRYETYREQRHETLLELIKNTANDQLKGNASCSQDFSHLYRHKTRTELIRISAAVMGIEFSYAAETAFVSPTLLKIGVKHQHMTLVWALSPLIGFFLCPILGSMSDRCKLNMGRRRPFIIFLSIGVFLGLLLVPNGEQLGYLFGDSGSHFQPELLNNGTQKNNDSNVDFSVQNESSHPWGIFFTVLGTILLDFDADACQSPARAYLLDVCIPEDHAKGLSTFTIMAGLGGFMGYSMGGINWDVTSIGKRLGGHVKAVFTIITFLFIACVTATITSFKEIPLWVLAAPNYKSEPKNEESRLKTTDSYGSLKCTDPFQPLQEEDYLNQGERSYQTFTETAADGENKLDSCKISENIVETSFTSELEPSAQEHNASTKDSVETLSHYLLSIIYMPHSLRMVCLTNLFCWMAHVCYSLYFTDFVGEAVFKGNPSAPEGSSDQIRYEEGVRFGCWGMAMYSLSCACYSLVIEKLIQKYKAKYVYIGGLLFYSTGMTIMAITRAKASVIIFSWTAGVMYSTLFTMPYLLVAHYHSVGIFELNFDGSAKVEAGVRGLGTDIAIVSSMVFLAQFTLSMCMGAVVSISGTTTAVVSTASFLSFCGAISATKIMYLDL